MNILHLIESVQQYGAETVVLDLMELQNQRGWQPVLGSIGGDPEAIRPFEQAAEARGLIVQKFPMRRGLNLLGGQRIADYAKQHGFDLIHSHSYKPNIIVGCLPKSMLQIPLLVTLHGWRPATTLNKRLIQWLELHGIRRADHVVAVDGTLATSLRLSGLRDKPTVIANGIQNPVQRDVGELESFIGGDFAIAAIGRLSSEKGFDMLVRAVAKIRERGIECIAAIFGEGEERSRLECLIGELGLAEHVRLMGYVPGASGCLGPFDCVAIPSTTEGCPLVALEAISLGIPVVASAVGGLPEILREGVAGVLVPPGDVDALAENLCEVASGENREFRTERTEQFGLGRYSADTMERSYAEVVRRLTRRSR